MATDAGDVIYQPDVLNSRQTLGDAIIQMPMAGAIGKTLTTVRVFGAGAAGVAGKYHKRMHNSSFQVRTGPWSPTNSF